jgi:hypothetical protein
VLPSRGDRAVTHTFSRLDVGRRAQLAPSLLAVRPTTSRRAGLSAVNPADEQSPRTAWAVGEEVADGGPYVIGSASKATAARTASTRTHARRQGGGETEQRLHAVVVCRRHRSWPGGGAFAPAAPSRHGAGRQTAQVVICRPPLRFRFYVWAEEVACGESSEIR